VNHIVLMTTPRVRLGSAYLGDRRCRFLVWAPQAERVEVVLLSSRREVVSMGRREQGYHEAVIEGVKAGARYVYRLDGVGEFPDPASRSQPDGVHEASEVVDQRFAWRDRLTTATRSSNSVPRVDCVG
jgi:maltooligosyltrehalose trehalohydrolase